MLPCVMKIRDSDWSIENKSAIHAIFFGVQIHPWTIAELSMADKQRISQEKKVFFSSSLLTRIQIYIYRVVYQCHMATRYLMIDG